MLSEEEIDCRWREREGKRHIIPLFFQKCPGPLKATTENSFSEKIEGINHVTEFFRSSSFLGEQEKKLLDRK